MYWKCELWSIDRSNIKTQKEKLKIMEQTMKVVVLGANRYSFEEQGTKRTIEGTKVHYINIGNESGENELGSIPKSQIMDYSYFNQLGQVPGLYEAKVQFDMSGKTMKAKIVHFKFLEQVSFELPVKA